MLYVNNNFVVICYNLLIAQKKGGKFVFCYQRLRDIREDRHITQQKIAQILNTTQQQYARWELGHNEMPMHNFIILAKYYNVSLDYLSGISSIPRTLDGSPYQF